jgi:DNA-binding XRE family transcriptional regulator
MEKPKYVELNGRDYVILAREEYERLLGMEKVANLPPVPEPDAAGNYPAVDYVRASIARDVVRERAELGLTQRDLAELAGVRIETVCRIETGKHTASTATIEKLDRALKRVRDKGKRKRKSKRGRKAS